MDVQLNKIETVEMTCQGCIFNGDDYSSHCLRPDDLECMDPEEGKNYIFTVEAPM